MTFRALSRGGALVLLCALLALPATMANAAAGSRTTTSAKKKPAVSAKSRATAAARKRASSRRGRRAPLPKDGVYSRNAILVDPTSGEVLYEKNSGRQVPIASLTKLMTALVFVEQKPDLERTAEVQATDLAGGGLTRLRKGEQVSLGDLLHMSLMCSDNVATRILARSTVLGPADFIARMDQKAVELGLTHTSFVEPTGLDARNVSSASDVARLLHAAAHDPVIQGITTTRQYTVHAGARSHVFGNTNRLLYGDRYEILGGKTGFISQAGYCFATWVRSQGRDVIAVVLGAPTAATRFADASRMIQKTNSVAPTGL